MQTKAREGSRASDRLAHLLSGQRKGPRYQSSAAGCRCWNTRFVLTQPCPPLCYPRLSGPLPSTDLAELEEAKNAHIADLMAQHEAAFRDMSAYYNQVARLGWLRWGNGPPS